MYTLYRTRIIIMFGVYVCYFKLCKKKKQQQKNFYYLLFIFTIFSLTTLFFFNIAS